MHTNVVDLYFVNMKLKFKNHCQRLCGAVPAVATLPQHQAFLRRRINILRRIVKMTAIVHKTGQPQAVFTNVVRCLFLDCGIPKLIVAADLFARCYFDIVALLQY